VSRFKAETEKKKSRISQLLVAAWASFILALTTGPPSYTIMFMASFPHNNFWQDSLVYALGIRGECDWRVMKAKLPRLQLGKLTSTYLPKLLCYQY